MDIGILYGHVPGSILVEGDLTVNQMEENVAPIAIASIVFACVFGGALLGMFLRTVLPEHHLREDSKDVVKVVTGLIATLSALVLGLLIASAKRLVRLD